MIGTTISHYRILEKLGEGGMGVVYKAEDLKLQRTVALKFLPHHLSATHEDQERFLQEARAASALNHPNVCTIYAIEEEGDEAFIAMEYVEGVTLREKIIGGGKWQVTGGGEEGIRGQGPGVSQDHGIGYAIQIAEALQEAHGHGIVHRDIKADNIMVNSKNQVKVMDFGLAKLKGSVKLAKTTSTLGTLAYMAPEQIQGGAADARSDIFSFGVVLYEMLTGHMPFRGEHEAAIMYSILNEEPEPIQRYLPDISSELIHIVNRALDKDPEDRYQSAHDIVIDLRRLKKQSTRVVRPTGAISSVDPTGENLTTSTTPAMPQRPRRKIWFLGLGVAVVGMAAVLVFLLSRGGPELNPEMKIHVLPTPLRNVAYGSLSPDGNWLVYPGSDEGGKFDLYMMNIASGQPRRVTFDSCASINGADLSPDGSTILYARSNTAVGPYTITSVPSVGGVSKEIVERGFAPGWLPSGKRLAYLTGSRLSNKWSTVELWSCLPDGSDRKCEFSDTIRTRPDARMGYSFSPDCRSIAWTRSGDEWSEIIVRDLETGHEVQLTDDKKYADDPLWLPNGYVVFSSTRGGNCNLWAAPAGGGKLVQVTRGTGPDAPCGYSPILNRLVYAEMQGVGHVKIVDLESGSAQQLTVEDRVRGSASISENGRYVAFVEQGDDATSARNNIFIADRQAGTTRKLTDDEEVKVATAISPDAAWLLYCSRRLSENNDSARVFLMPVSNPGQKRLLGHGNMLMWVNNTEFSAWHSGRPIFYSGSIGSQTLEKPGPDSIRYFPIAGERYAFLFDYRASRRGVWITPASTGTQAKGERLVLRELPVEGDIACSAGMFFYRLRGSDIVQRMSLPDGKSVQLKTPLPTLRFAFRVRPDGKELVYTNFSVRTRHVAIEEFLK